MDIKHSRRILTVGAPNSGALEIIQKLTGAAPQPHDGGSTAGLTHEWSVETKYYRATVPIWIDEIPDVEAWKSEFLRPEAKEVVDAVGAWIYCFKMPQNIQEKKGVEVTMQAISEVVEAHADYGGNALMLAVALSGPAPPQRLATPGQDAWDDLCLQYGFEFLDFHAHEVSEFGEKVGLERLKEALEANEWADEAASDEDLAGLGLGSETDSNDGESERYGFARDEAEMTAELFGMKAALAHDDFEPDPGASSPAEQQEDQVDDLDRLMSKLLAVKENSVGLPEAQRRRMAAQVVSELMKESSI